MYGLFQIIYKPDTEPPEDLQGNAFTRGDEWSTHSACTISLVLTLAADGNTSADNALAALAASVTGDAGETTDALAKALRRELAAAHAWIASIQRDRLHVIERTQTPTTPEALSHQRRLQHEPIENASLATESIARRLEQAGDRGVELANKSRERARERWVQYQSGEQSVVGVLKEWQPNESGAPPILRALAEALWSDCISAVATAKPLLARNYAPSPKLTAGIAWAFGGIAVEIDGRKFGLAPESGVRVFGPRTAMLLAQIRDTCITPSAE